MTDIVERLRAERPEFYESTMQEAAAEIEQLRALLQRHDDSWRLLHEREYTGALRDDTRAALSDEQNEDYAGVAER
jgi:hypothetical protein